MAQIVGTVISVGVNVPVKKQGGGTYQGSELVYKSADGEVRSIAKPVTGLRFNKALEAALGELNAGDVFTLTQEKNQAGYNDVKSIEKGDVRGATTSVANHTPAPSGSAQTNRTFESADERALRQRLIVRQSSLTAAIEILKNGDKKTPLNLDNVTALANDLMLWVYESGNAQGTDEFKDDIPF